MPETSWLTLARRIAHGMLATVLSATSAAAPACAADDEPSRAAEASPGRRATGKTLGGRQFWADVEYFHDWRIQRHVLTGHHRLLDRDDYRHASGTRDECRRVLESIKVERKLEPMSGEAVILVHGIVRSSKSMRKLEQALALDDAGYRTFSFDYPSTLVDIQSAARSLHSVIESLEGIERIHFVTHSMGGLIVRAYLAEHDDPRLGRMVMIATPNQGAELADRFRTNLVYRVLFGPAGQQLGRDREGLIATLPTPEFEFGVIAGGRGTPDGYNPLIPGDDDGTVSVESTRLAGAADFVVVNRMHTFLVSAPEAREYTVRFLKEGRFREKGERQPIADENQAAEAEQAAQGSGQSDDTP